MDPTTAANAPIANNAESLFNSEAVAKPGSTDNHNFRYNILESNLLILRIETIPASVDTLYIGTEWVVATCIFDL